MQPCALLNLVVVLTSAAAVYGHGGRYPPPPAPAKPPPPPSYAGPEDGRRPAPATPPAGGGRGAGPSTQGPGAPAPRGPVTGPATAPSSAPGAAGTQPRGYAIEPDPTAWSLWWGYHRYDYLQVQRTLRSAALVTGSDDFYLGGSRRGDERDHLALTRDHLERDVVPRLLHELTHSNSRPLVLTSMLTLAKIGITDADKRLLPLLLVRLKSNNQEIAETAALALGLSRCPQSMTPLSELFLDTEKGRELAQRARVDQRMRAFAGYGIGLLASDATDPSLPRLAAMVLEQALSPSLRTRDANRDVLIAAITAFGLLPTEGMREHVLRPLLEFYAQARGKGDEVAQAHVPPALAAVLGRGGDKSGEIVAQLVQDLEDPERTHVIRQSAAIALGELCDASARHAAAGDALWRYVQDGKDQQTCAFSLIALAHIGGDRNRTALLNRLRSTTTIERPWVALALGVLAHEQRALGVDRTIGRELAWAMKDSKNEDVIAATAIGLGLSGATEAAADVRELLSRHRQRPTLAAHLCTALALLDDTAAVPLLREVMAQSARHPQLLTEAASALVRLGERAVGTELAGLMAVPGQELTTLTGAATALATVGDRRCLPALLDVLSRPSVPDLGRAYAIVAIGGIGDRDDVPLSNRLTRRLNYRATVETLTNQTTGVLDIL